LAAQVVAKFVPGAGAIMSVYNIAKWVVDNQAQLQELFQKFLQSIDAWFSGSTANGLRKQLGDLIQQKWAAGIDVKLTVLFLRERIGYEKNIPAGETIKTTIVNDGMSIHEYRLQMVLGEDVAKIYGNWGDKTLRVFDDTGRVRYRMVAGQGTLTTLSTRQIFIQLMSGQLDYHSFPVT
jgi:hypothetical protein